MNETFDDPEEWPEGAPTEEEQRRIIADFEARRLTADNMTSTQTRVIALWYAHEVARAREKERGALERANKSLEGIKEDAQQNEAELRRILETVTATLDAKRRGRA